MTQRDIDRIDDRADRELKRPARRKAMAGSERRRKHSLRDHVAGRTLDDIEREEARYGQ